MTTLHLATRRRQKTRAHCWLAAGLSRNLVNFVKWCLVFGACVITGSIMASVLSGLSGVKPFNVHEDRSSLGQPWNRWISQFELYVLASGVSDDAQKRALLLHMSGPDVQDIFNTLSDSTGTYDSAKNITRVASWGPDRRKWLFSEVRGGIWTPHSLVLIKISADKRPLNQLTVKNLFFSLFIKTFCL